MVERLTPYNSVPLPTFPALNTTSLRNLNDKRERVEITHQKGLLDIEHYGELGLVQKSLDATSCLQMLT